MNLAYSMYMHLDFHLSLPMADPSYLCRTKNIPVLLSECFPRPRTDTVRLIINCSPRLEHKLGKFSSSYDWLFECLNKAHYSDGESYDFVPVSSTSGSTSLSRIVITGLLNVNLWTTGVTSILRLSVKKVYSNKCSPPLFCYRCTFNQFPQS